MMKIPSLKKHITFIVLLSLAECILVGYLGWWRNPFWAAVEALDIHKFWIYLGYFSIAALGACFVSGLSEYYINYAALIMRYKLTRKAFKVNYNAVEGGHQRVQEDCWKYPQLLIVLAVGFSKNILTLIIFTVIIVKQLGFMYLLIPVAYSLIGTGLASKLAKPLIFLNYINQNFEAKFRQMITKLNYGLVHRNNYNLFTVTKRLTYFQSFYNQITVIVPYIILSPLYFSKMIVFGVLMQCAALIAQLVESMSYVINSFSDINKWLSCRRRLKEIGVI